MKLLSTCFVFFIAMAAMMAGCNKGGGTPPPPPPGGDSVTVYFGGRADGEPSPPAFWKGNQQVNLTSPFGGDVFSIDVQGSNVYLGGRMYAEGGQTRSLPCFWREDGSREDLPLIKPNSVGLVKSVRESAGVIYGGGICSDSLPSPVNKWLYQPVVWKSNEDKPILLEPLAYHSFYGASGMVQAIGTIANSNKTGWVAAGSSMGEEGFDDPCYWSKGLASIVVPNDEIEAKPLSNFGYGGSALGVNMTLDPNFGEDLSQAEIIIVGYVDNEDEYNVPCYWLLGTPGGTRHDLPRLSNNGHGAATAAYKGSQGLLIAGYCYSSTDVQVPCYWKGGNRTDLPLPAGAFGATAVSVFSVKDDIYVGGTVNTTTGNFPCYWKNGQFVQHPLRGIAYGMDLDD